MSWTADDQRWMAQALRLAERGLYTTQPNPRVGCVLVRDGGVVGEGWHQRAGGPHAEVFALRAAGDQARGATVYVTLEPCGLQGRTPPCVDALIDAAVDRVIIATDDAFQRDGDAIQRLRHAGIRVGTGLMQDAARELNRGFFARIEHGRPWVRVKLAMSLDGRTALASGESKWITSEASRNDVQRWRARSSAIMTGSGTVLADDPRLTARLSAIDHRWWNPRRAEPPQAIPPQACGEAGGGIACGGSVLRDMSGIAGIVTPLRVVLDRRLRTPAGAHVLDGSVPTLLAHGGDAVQPGDGRFDRVERVAIDDDDDRIDLEAILALLARRGCNEVQVEAGPTLCGALFAAGLVDELLLYIAPVMLGDTARPLLALPPLATMTERWQLAVLDQRNVGNDIRLLLRPR